MVTAENTSSIILNIQGISHRFKEEIFWSLYMGIIYKILCKETNKSYIGKTIQQLKTRLKQHKEPRSYCRALSEAIKNHGWDNFEVSVVWEGENQMLGEMEKKYISEHDTLEPNGYNIREGGGRSEKVSDLSRKLMIEKQREISRRRNGLLGGVFPNKSRKDGSITSWYFKVTVNNTSYVVGSLKTRGEAEEIQKLYNENPDTFQFQSPKRAGNGKGGIYFDKSRGKWQVMVKNKFLGRFDSKEKAEAVLKEYSKDPENFEKPKADVKYGHIYNCRDRWALRYRGKHIGMYDTKKSAEKMIEYLNVRVKTKKDTQKVLDDYIELKRVFTTWKTHCKNSLAENRTPIDALTVHKLNH